MDQNFCTEAVSSPKYSYPRKSVAGENVSGDDIDVTFSCEALNDHRHDFDLIVRRYQAQIYHFLLRHTQQSDDALDLTQEAFVQAYIKFRTWRGEGKLSSWLIGIALNIARNHANRNPYLRIAHSPLDDFDDDMSGGCGDDPEQVFSNMARHAALSSALEQLPAELREPLILVAVDDISYGEVAQSLGLPLGTLKSRLNRGRRLLRQALILHL